MYRSCALILCLTSTAAHACPNGSENLVSCTFDGGKKQLQTCMAGNQISYSFGRTRRTPDLALSRHIHHVDHYPWPGVSRTIWESFSFENAGISYRVYYAQERDPRTPEISGGLYVEQDEETLAELICDAGSVITEGYPLPIFDAKVAAGQHFDRETYSWSTPE